MECLLKKCCTLSICVLFFLSFAAAQNALTVYYDFTNLSSEEPLSFTPQSQAENLSEDNKPDELTFLSNAWKLNVSNFISDASADGIQLSVVPAPEDTDSFAAPYVYYSFTMYQDSDFYREPDTICIKAVCCSKPDKTETFTCDTYKRSAELKDTSLFLKKLVHAGIAYQISSVPVKPSPDIPLKEIDSFDVEGYMNGNHNYLLQKYQIVPQKNFSFIIQSYNADGCSPVTVSPLWNKKGIITKKMAADGIKFRNSLLMHETSDGNIIMEEFPKNIFYEVNPKTGEYKSLNFGENAFTVLNYLSDGTPYVTSENYDDNEYVSLLSPDESGYKDVMIFPQNTSLYSGPDASFILFNSTDGRVSIYEKDGSLRKFIFLNNFSEMKKNKIDTEISLISSDGSMLFAGRGGVTVKYNSDGKIEWYTNKIQPVFRISIWAAEKDGVYYLISGTKIYRYAEPDAQLNPVMEETAAVAKDETCKGSAKYLAYAKIFSKYGAWRDAEFNSEQYLKYNPADSEAAALYVNAQIENLKEDSTTDGKLALDSFTAYGKETARPLYEKAMTEYEKLNSLFPGNPEVQKNMNELRSKFDSSGTDIKVSLQPRLDSIELTALFPALLSTYASKPSGVIKITNTGKSLYRNIRADCFIKNYMDYASEGETIRELKPGNSAELKLFTRLNQSVLSLESDTPTQILYTINYEENGKSYTETAVRPVTIYKKSALTWDNTAKLASFITPSDNIITSFAFSALAGVPSRQFISDNFRRAVVLAESIGKIPLSYIPDPQPTSDALQHKYAVDTVRLPRETLDYTAGDCDDMTALFCSVLESIGIPTAILTTPGHVFAAFDTGTKPDELWASIPAQYSAIENGGTIWIPVETTMLSKGFIEAWKNASLFYEKAKNSSDHDFVKVADATKEFPAEPVPHSDKSAPVPPAYKTASASDTSFTLLEQQMLPPAVKLIKDNMPPSYGGEWEKKQNRLAKEYARFGKNNNAIECLNQIIEKNPENKAARANLAFLYAKIGNNEKSQEYSTEFSKPVIAVSGDSDSEDRAENADVFTWSE